MDALSHLFQGFGAAILPVNLLFAGIGVLLGTAVGVLPGIGPALTVALLLPVTFQLDPGGSLIRSASVWWGEFFGTTTTSGSPVSRAIGVTLVRFTGELLVRIAPTMVMPPTRSWSSAPRACCANCARPTVPPAPGTFCTCTLRALPDLTIASCSARAALSQPPPAPAGAMMLSSRSCATTGETLAATAMHAARSRDLKNDMSSSPVALLPYVFPVPPKSNIVAAVAPAGAGGVSAGPASGPVACRPVRRRCRAGTEARRP